MRKEISEIKSLLQCARSAEELSRLRGKKNHLLLRLSIMAPDVSLRKEADYLNKIKNK